MYHAIIIKESLRNKKVLDDLDIITSKDDDGWTMYIVAVSDEKLKDTIKKMQENINGSQGWYFHFYNRDGSKMVIVYKNKAFFTDNKSENWKEAIEYGTGLGIPKEQLDFVPNTFATEEY